MLCIAFELLHDEICTYEYMILKAIIFDGRFTVKFFYLFQKIHWFNKRRPFLALEDQSEPFFMPVLKSDIEEKPETGTGEYKSYQYLKY